MIFQGEALEMEADQIAGPGGGVKAAVNFACQRRSLTIIFTEDEYCLIDVKVCVMMLTHDTEHVLTV